MNIKKLQLLVVDALEDVKAQDIRVYDTTGLTDLFDSVVIASGTSNRQTRSLATSVRDKAKEAGADVISVEGTETGEWVLVDLGDMVVHIMQPGIRTYYNLEELWGRKPVNLKAVAVKAPAKKAPAPAKKVAAKKVAAKKVATKKNPAKKAPATKAALTKTAAVKKPASKTAAASKTAVRKTPARKTASKAG